MTIFKPLLAAACVAYLASADMALAQSAPGTVQGGVNNEQKRINEGNATGRLTAREDANVESHTQSIEAQRDRDLAAHGGHLTQAERVHLDHRLQNNSSRVYRLKHNDAKAAPHG